MPEPIRIYTDTSVFGGVFDPEFSSASAAFFERAREGRVEVVVSALVLSEIRGAPETVQDFMADMVPHLVRVRVSDAAYRLREAYINAGIVSDRWRADALHVAIATVSGCQAIVSWNFRHIVNFRRIPLYNGVNRMQGYQPIAIHAPTEIVFDEEE
jgi:predicted nucleic acid-binding protein